MATQTPEGVFSLPAAVDLTGKQYRLVVKNGSGELAICGEGARPTGILQTPDAAVGEQARYHTFHGQGREKAVAGAAFARNVKLASDAEGRIVLASAGDEVIGTSEEAATAAGQVVAFQPDLQGILPA